jgi:hypothetical protein
MYLHFPRDRWSSDVSCFGLKKDNNDYQKCSSLILSVRVCNIIKYLFLSVLNFTALKLNQMGGVAEVEIYEVNTKIFCRPK